MKRLIAVAILSFGICAHAGKNKQKPLVVLLHGCKQSAADFVNLTGFDQLAQENDFLIYTPEQSVWMNPYKCWNWFSLMNQKRGLVGETVSIVEAVQKIQRQHDIDPKRIYVAGFSAGAGLSLNLLYCFPDVFAGAAVHSGPVYGVATDGVAARKVMANASGLSKTELQKRALACAGQPAKSFSRKRLIILQGDQDEVVHVQNSKEIQKQFPGHAKLHLFEGLGHDWDVSSSQTILEELGLLKN